LFVLLLADRGTLQHCNGVVKFPGTGRDTRFQIGVERPQLRSGPLLRLDILDRRV
jgi:hypothetical protein